jgi:hypothetical protein
MEINTSMALVEAFTTINSRANEYVSKASVNAMSRVLRRLFIEPGLKNTITNYGILEWLVQRDSLGLYDVLSTLSHFEVVHKPAVSKGAEGRAAYVTHIVQANGDCDCRYREAFGVPCRHAAAMLSQTGQLKNPSHSLFGASLTRSCARAPRRQAAAHR